MDIQVFLSTLLARDEAVLPGLAAMRIALSGGWAIVLGSAAWALTRPLARRYRLGLLLLVMAWTLLPGPASPAYWLGLAFQAPSWSSALIGLGLLWRARKGVRTIEPGATQTAAPAPRGLGLLVLAGIALGWVLLLDTLACWPVSVYAWGFSPAAAAAVALLATLYWAVVGAADSPRVRLASVWPALPAMVVVLFVATRLPTGNLWDALIDPWLWMALQVAWLVSAARRWRRVKRPQAAIRA